MSRLFILLLVICLAGCNIVYKQSIQQGNVLDLEDIEQLETGMTKRQVSVLLGSPAVDNPFHADRWDYINSFSRRGGKPDLRTLTIRFENDRVVEFSGNYLENARAAEAEIDELEIIDPNTNRPVLPPREPGQDDGEPGDNDQD
ncbi:MAG: outer membrane protein assembly factor BamE [Wenzhouxiangellaceae bacterium]|nr:outer membrane protein assembly factor BamE [Wenzhouxiangellaceae bacterium]